ncbi:MAG: DUF1343 domain-containing protein [Bacteroidales bacterium]|jgi:uncharacterized protein YbbC (DUF1343 family)|nr:DUF1343 domain-containing protein [Bacteroidales bacterium]
MFSFRTTPLEKQEDLALKKGRIAILCNQTAWHTETGEYIFETLARRYNLKRVFIPEHGLFGELQDRTEQKDRLSYGINSDVEFVSLYGQNEESTYAETDKLTDIDALVIELQDVGCRYYTYISTIFNIFKTLKYNEIDLPVYIIDKPNPAGRQVEGTMLRAGYRSFIGIEGIPHRHGLTIGELSYFLYNELHARFPLHIISYKASQSNKDLMPWSIPPSPNFPGFFTAHFYSGQCLWEGTNVSEGRGTTRPFEIFGAPFMKSLINFNSVHSYTNWNDKNNPMHDSGAFVRWLEFVPCYDKYANERCFGFQLLATPNMQYNALAHNLRIMRFIKDNCEGFEFRNGKFESGNDKSAIELLLGDKELIDFVNGSGDWKDIKEHIKIEEQKWIKKTKKILLYPEEQLFRIK